MTLKKTLLAVVPGLLALIGLATGACPDNCKCDLIRKVVDCRDAGLTRIPWELPDPSGLTELDLRGNQIHGIISSIVPYPNLEYLDLSENELIDIEDSVFSALASLKFLYLQNNRLTAVTERTFQGLGTLKELDISHNEIRILPDKIFSDLQELESLNLAGNGIGQIREDTYLGLVSLKSLNLGDNRLTTIPVQALKKVPRVTHLYLENNHLDTVPTHAFREMKELRVLNLEGNEISDISENAFHDHESTDTPQVEKVVLSSNRLGRVPTASLSRLANLVHVDLSENPIQVVDPDAFKGHARLRSIYLNSLPELQVVRSYAFSELEGLEVIEMHSNRALADIEEDAFIATTKLRRVDLHANQLQTVGANVLEWEDLERVDLRYNPWQCDCHLKWMPGALSQLTTNVSRSLAKDVKCDSPDELAGHRLLELSSHQLVCPKPKHPFEDRVMIGIITGICLLLFVIMLYLLYKHKYCSMGHGGKRHRIIDYQGHRHCNGRGPVVCDGRNDEDDREHIAENEHQPEGRLDNLV